MTTAKPPLPRPTAAASSPVPVSRRALILVLLLSGLGGMFVGIVFPLVALALELKGESGAVIGLNSTFGSLGILTMGVLTPRLLARFGTVPALIGASLLTTLTLLGYLLSDALPWWFVLRYVQALGMGLIWVGTESWLNSLAPDHRRGTVMGAYSMIFSGGLTLGPVIIAGLGGVGPQTFLVVAALPLLWLPMIWSLRRVPTPAEAHPAEGAAPITIKGAPGLFLFAAAAGMIEVACITLMPVFSLRNGLPEDLALVGLTAFSAGALVMQLPLGRIADRLAPDVMMLLTLAGTLVPAALLPWAVGQGTGALFPVLFLLGGFGFGLYTIGLTVMGKRYQGSALLAANARFMIVYEAAAVAGPAIGGLGLDHAPRFGLPAFLVVVIVLVMAVVAGRGLTRWRNPDPSP
ncbi:MFS transporter [Roseospirillum parvum]|uniref:Predicted arabinose efflux permease, MFS family n=1 Tax=Roseospirillum parvum TaxID=83401 RepID=A0A1G7US69_9PROT|nr:MFS transporter [Roseospirillum parvum]SDG49590.1 Predicted arabinose efflux permease, MFS family [Roseospirillum parvum]